MKTDKELALSDNDFWFAEASVNCRAATDELNANGLSPLYAIYLERYNLASKRFKVSCEECRKLLST
jgi:hypothetical protein